MNLDKNLLRLGRESRVLLALTIGLGVAAGIGSVWQAQTLSRIVNQVFLEDGDLASAIALLTLLLGVILARAGFAWGSDVAANAIAVRIKTMLRRRLFAHLLDLGPSFSRSERTGELISVAVEGIEALDAYFSQYLPQLALAALVPLTFLVFVVPLDLLTAVVLVLTAPLIPLFMILIGNLAQALTRRQWQTLSRMSAYFLDVLQGLTTLKILGRSQAQLGVIAQVSDQFRQVTMSVLRVTFLSALVLEMVSTLSTAVVAVEIGLRLLYGRLVFEQAFFVLLLAPEFYLPLRMLGTRFHAGMSGVAAARRIFEILDTPVPIRLKPSLEEGEKAIARIEEQAAIGALFPIRFEGVHYRYADQKKACQGDQDLAAQDAGPTARPALEDVSFSLEVGQKVALVGPSGGGKSTIAGLLLRFMEPESGQIWAGSQPLAYIEPQAWRRNVAWVPQNPYLFDDTLAANIRLACPSASQDEVVRAAQLAHADLFARRLPQGYETRLGEGGARLSGGQIQRVALARAFLKNAPVLILDEATSQLDLESEALIRDAIDRLVLGRTTLIIAHRLNTVVGADRILVLDKGRVVESGTHTVLSQGQTLYLQLLAAYGGA